MLSDVAFPSDSDPNAVLAEAQRLEDLANTPVEVPVEPTPDEKLDAAIVEYVSVGGKPETVADKAVAQMSQAVAVAYLDQKAVDVKPEPKPGEKPAVHIRKDEKYALCGYFLGPYTWAFADAKQAQQEVDARGVVEICPKCLDIAGVK
jgi:hypothetical protein